MQASYLLRVFRKEFTQVLKGCEFKITLLKNFIDRPFIVLDNDSKCGQAIITRGAV